MSNLKKDIEKILRDVYYAGYNDTDLEWGEPDERYIKEIIDLIESAVDSTSPSKYRTSTSYKKAIKSKLIGEG